MQGQGKALVKALLLSFLVRRRGVQSSLGDFQFFQLSQQSNTSVRIKHA